MLLIADGELAISRKHNVALFLLEGVLDHLREDMPVAQKQVAIIFEWAELELVLEEQRVLVILIKYADYQLFVFAKQFHLDTNWLFIYLVLTIFCLH